MYDIPYVWACSGGKVFFFYGKIVPTWGRDHVVAVDGVDEVSSDTI